MNKEELKTVKKIQEALDTRFNDPELPLRAVTHSSYAHEKTQANNHNGEGERVEHYERLEFLGDAVLSVVVSDLVMGYFPDATEGELSRVRAGLVNCERLAALARDLGLGQLIRLGRGEESTGGSDKSSILADVYEAVLAAVYLDRGFERTKQLIENHFVPLLQDLPPIELLGDFKTPLQEMVQTKFKTTPRYRVVGEDGPDHEKTFTVEVIVDGKSRGAGSGRSKKEAEQFAARKALKSGIFDE